MTWREPEQQQTETTGPTTTPLNSADMEIDNALHPHPQEMTTDPPFGIRMRFAQCPPGLTCPHAECTFPHRDNPIRLTRHWRYAHGDDIIPDGVVDDSHYNRVNARIRAQQCPHHNCNFVHNRSISRLNTHLQNCHNGTPLPTQHHLPYNLRPCFDCNMIIDHRSLVSHRHNCPASSGRHSTTSTRQNTQGYTPPITSFFRRDDSDPDPHHNGHQLAGIHHIYKSTPGIADTCTHRRESPITGQGNIKQFSESGIRKQCTPTSPAGCTDSKPS